MKEPDAKYVPATKASDCPDAKWVAGYPTICEYMACEAYETGKAREPSAIGVKIQGGKMCVYINDTDVRRSIYVSGDTFELAMRALEKQLASGAPEWRYWKGGKGGKK